MIHSDAMQAKAIRKYHLQQTHSFDGHRAKLAGVIQCAIKALKSRFDAARSRVIAENGSISGLDEVNFQLGNFADDCSILRCVQQAEWAITEQVPNNLISSN